MGDREPGLLGFSLDKGKAQSIPGFYGLSLTPHLLTSAVPVEQGPAPECHGAADPQTLGRPQPWPQPCLCPAPPARSSPGSLHWQAAPLQGAKGYTRPRPAPSPWTMGSISSCGLVTKGLNMLGGVGSQDTWVPPQASKGQAQGLEQDTWARWQQMGLTPNALPALDRTQASCPPCPAHPQALAPLAGGSLDPPRGRKPGPLYRCRPRKPPPAPDDPPAPPDPAHTPGHPHLSPAGRRPGCSCSPAARSRRPGAAGRCRWRWRRSAARGGSALGAETPAEPPARIPLPTRPGLGAGTTVPPTPNGPDQPL